ncbi:MAG: nucleotide exchange factor GrpE [Candidatus Parvarchaeota archaeon]|nr:nucleotide exchange factor GrpE [Candidatus Parvarchaeota archaeon]
MEKEDTTKNEDKITYQEDDTHEEKEYKEKYLYLLAEFDNYRKSLDKQIVEEKKLIREKIILDLLKVLDDFDNVMKTDKDDKIELLMKSLYNTLKSYGLSRMEVIGQDYSPEIAEAVATENIKDKTGKIIEEIQPGYKLNDKVIRYPKVKIGV